MSVIIGRVSEHDLSNITVGGKVIFVPPEKRNAAWINFPAGTVAKVMADKGTATSIVPPSPAEMAAFTREEMAGNNKPPAAVKPGTKTEPTQAPPSTPAANSQAVKDAIQQTKDALKKGTAMASPSSIDRMTDEEFERKIIDLLKNNPEVRAKIQEIRGEKPNGVPS